MRERVDADEAAGAEGSSAEDWTMRNDVVHAERIGKHLQKEAIVAEAANSRIFSLHPMSKNGGALSTELIF